MQGKGTRPLIGCLDVSSFLIGRRCTAKSVYETCMVARDCCIPNVVRNCRICLAAHYGMLKKFHILNPHYGILFGICTMYQKIDAETVQAQWPRPLHQRDLPVSYLARLVSFVPFLLRNKFVTALNVPCSIKKLLFSLRIRVPKLTDDWNMVIRLICRRL